MKRLRLIYGLPIVLAGAVMVILVAHNLAAQQQIAAPPLSYDVSPYSEEEWVQRGRAAAQGVGMVGEPVHEEWALLTRGSYDTLLGGGGDAERREEPIFVYQAFGDIPEFIMFGMDGPVRDLGGVRFMYDGTTGQIFSWAGLPKGAMSGKDVGLDLNFIPADRGPSAEAQLPPPTMIPLN